ncbi:MAG: cobyric acid synthase, partial [Fervidobacterium sp.]
GFKVCPFKSMNLSSNAFVTDDGLQMAWAQAVQAFAAKIEPKVYMNPILLKPLGNYTSSVFYMGKELGKMSANEYNNFKLTIKDKVKEIFESIHSRYDIVVIEGAGSPAEINLKKNDIVNMGMAKIANSNVILVADIDRGGAFASIYGTYMLLDEDEKAKIKGIIINKFHGKISLLKDGIKELERLINVPVIGVMPYVDLKIIDEDSLSMSMFRRKEFDK